MIYQVERIVVRYRWIAVLSLAGLGFFLLFSAHTPVARCSLPQTTGVCEGELIAYATVNPWLGAGGGMLLSTALLVYHHRRP